MLLKLLTDEDHLMATAKAGYEFADGTQFIDFGLAKDSGVSCETKAPSIDLVTTVCDSLKSDVAEGSISFTATNTADGFGAPATYTWHVSQGDTVVASGETLSVTDGAISDTITIPHLSSGTYYCHY